MCLAVPARVLEVREGHTALVDLGGVETETRIDLVPEVSVGQYVIIHAGFAINILDEEDAEETLRLLETLDALGRISGP
jgi:hydrogenase expression/formation protein HypC